METEDIKELTEEVPEAKLIIKEMFPDDNKKFLHKVFTMLKDGRRYFGRAGVSLENQLNDPKYKKLENEEFKLNPKIIKLGISGEQSTSKILRNWMKDKNDVVLLDSISLPNNNLDPEEDDEGQLDLGDSDHVLIIGNKLIVLDSKNWKSKTSYKIDDDGQIKRGNKSFKGNRPRIQGMKHIWLKYYEKYDIDDVEMFVVIPSPDPFILRDRNWWRFGFKLVNQETLVYFLDKLYNEELEEKGFIRVELVANAITGLTVPYDPMKDVLGDSYEGIMKRLR